MAKVKAQIKLQIGRHGPRAAVPRSASGINIMDFCKQFNKPARGGCSSWSSRFGNSFTPSKMRSRRYSKAAGVKNSGEPNGTGRQITQKGRGHRPREAPDLNTKDLRVRQMVRQPARYRRRQVTYSTELHEGRQQVRRQEHGRIREPGQDLDLMVNKLEEAAESSSARPRSSTRPSSCTSRAWTQQAASRSTARGPAARGQIRRSPSCRGESRRTLRTPGPARRRRRPVESQRASPTSTCWSPRRT